jgi:ABC-type bacteriocin/lantibiotic exporter with double-glycine peptidase domain
MKENFVFWKKHTYLHPGNALLLVGSGIAQIVVLNLILGDAFTTRTGLITRGIILIALPLLGSIFSSKLARKSTEKLQQTLLKNLSLTQTNHLEKLHPQAFAKAATHDVDHFYQFWREFFANVGFNLPILFYLVVMLLVQNQWMVVTGSMAGLIVLAIIASKINYSIRRQQRVHHLAHIGLQDKIRNYVNNVLQFRLYRSEKGYLSVLGMDFTNFGKLTAKLIQSRQIYATCVSTILLMFLWGALWLLQNYRTVTPAQIAVVTLVFLEIRRIGNDIFTNINTFNRARESATILSPWLTEEIKKEQFDQKPFAFGEIAVQNLEFRYNDQDAPISYPDVQIKKGEKVWIKGRNGRGKSTLWKILTGLYTTPGNPLLVNDVAKNGNGLVPFWKRLAAVTEPARCFDGKIWEIIGNFSSDYETVHTWLSAHELLSSFDNYPFQLDTCYDSAVDNLSAGQLKWLLITQAFFQQPDLIILDEPFSSLDAERRKLTLRLVSELPNSTTCIVITHHDLPVKFDKTILL